MPVQLGCALPRVCEPAVLQRIRPASHVDDLQPHAGGRPTLSSSLKSRDIQRRRFSNGYGGTEHLQCLATFTGSVARRHRACIISHRLRSAPPSIPERLQRLGPAQQHTLVRLTTVVSSSIQRLLSSRSSKRIATVVPAARAVHNQRARAVRAAYLSEPSAL